MLKNLRNLIRYKLLNSFAPYLLLTIIVLIFFYPVWTLGKIPMPADIVVGVYFPWLDYKWAGYESGVPVKNPLISDVPSVIFPHRFLAIEQAKQGIVPLWNPLMFNGYPLMATFQSAVFYPLNFLYFIMPFLNAWSLQIILQLIFGCFFTYLFLRNLNLGKIPALFGSIAFGFGGFNLYWLEYNIHAHVAAFIPLLLYLTDRFLSSKNIKWLVFLSLGLAVQLFAGYPQLSVYSLILVLAWTFFRLELWKGNRKKLRSLILVGIFLLLGLALSSVQIIPGFELYQNSQRATEKLDTEARFLKFGQLITFLAPDYFGNSAAYNYWGPGDYTTVVGYTGIITFLLMVISLSFIKQKKEIKFFWIVLVICLFLIFDTPISRFMVTEILDKFLIGLKAASMTRALVLLNFSFAVLAAFSLEYLTKTKGSKSVFRLGLVPWTIVIGSLIGTFIVFYFLQKNEQVVTNQVISIRNLALPIILLSVSSLLVYLIFKIPRYKYVLSFMIVLLLAFELIRFGWKITPFSEKDFVFPKTPSLDFLINQQKPLRISTADTIPSNMWMPYNLETPDGYDAVYPKRVSRLLSLINYNNAEINEVSRYGRINNLTSKVLDLTNTEYILALKKNLQGKPDPNGEVDQALRSNRFTKVFDDKSVAILQNNSSLPRAFFVSNWEVIKQEKELLNRLIDPEFPLDKKIILEKKFNQFKISEENKSEVSYANYSFNKSEIEVSSDKDGFLFISDSFYPGWKAKVDDIESKIYLADYNFIAIPMKAGSHKVELYYDPLSFKLGLILSFSAFLVILSLGVILLNNNFYDTYP